jgi:hypothetical protein
METAQVDDRHNTADVFREELPIAGISGCQIPIFSTHPV